MSSTQVVSQVVHWLEQDEPHSALWRAESGATPENILVADDRMTADAAYRLARTGTALLWPPNMAVRWAICG